MVIYDWNLTFLIGTMGKRGLPGVEGSKGSIGTQGRFFLLADYKLDSNFNYF